MSSPPPERTVDADALRGLLAHRDPALLSAVLDAAHVAHDGVQEGSEALSERLVAALWWRTHTPAGHLVAPDDLGALVDRVADRAGVEVGDGDTWLRLASLTDALVPGNRPVSLDALDPETVRRLRRSAWGQVLGWTGVGASAASRWAAVRTLGLLQGPIFQMLRLLPTVGPVLVKAKGAAGAVAAVSGPVGIALALASLNASLGARYDRALPLLVGVGLVLRNPVVVR